MAKISTYEEVLLPKLEDKLIGTSVGGEPQDATFNFTLQQLLDLFVPNIPSNNLQGVLDLGNTATQDINLTGTINTVTLNATGNTLLKNTYLNGPVRISGPLSDVYNSAGTSGQVLSTTATSIKWITLPTYVELTATSPLVYNNITGNLSILQSSSTTNGYLSSVNWNTFNQKQSAISLTTDGSSGASTFLFNTLNIPEYTLSGLGGVPSSRTLTINGVTHDLSANRSWIISGGINSVTATSPVFSSGGANPNITIQEAGPTQGGYLSSSDWTIFNSKGSGTVTSVSGVSPVSSTGGNTPAISISKATTSVDGYLSSTDWTTFDSKQNALGFTPENVANKVTTISSASTNTEYPTAKLLYDSLSGLGAVSAVTATSPVSSTGGSTPDISIPQASASADGYLSSADWIAFDGKGGGSVTSVTATSPISSSGGTTPDISVSQSGAATDGYLSTTDWNTFNSKQASGNYITSLTGEATATGPGSASVTLGNSSVIGKVLTGLSTSTGGSIVATDSILTAFGKVQNQITGLIGGVTYQGVWNAATNTPTLTSSVGTQGYYYVVNVAGSTNLNGITDWKVGDWAIFNGTAWNKVDNTDAVSSVNGQIGAVSLTTDNISEGITNLYYLDSRARAALSFAAGSGAYNSTSGVITIPTNTSQLTNGAAFITLGSLTASSPLSYNNTTGAFSISQSSGSVDGYLSSTDWTTFNSKQNTITPAALTKTDDTNVTLTLGGSPTTSLLAATSITVGWTGTLADSRIASAAIWNAKQAALSGSGIVKSTAGTISYISGTSAQFVKGDGSLDSTTYGLGTVTSVGLSMPSAFNVASSPITTSGTIAVTGAGSTSQYIRGDGSLATYNPGGGGGGSSQVFYFNGGVASSVTGYQQMSTTANTGASTDFSVSANGYIASFLTDSASPSQLSIPAGNWDFKIYFNASSSGGSPSFYVELYKYNGSTFTLISSSSTNPEGITNGTTVDLYITALTVPATTLLITDRLAVRVYVLNSGRTITMHTQDSNLSEVITTFSTGITALNGLTTQIQNFAVGTGGTDFAISSVTNTHTFNLPTASTANRGALSSTDWTTFNGKEPAIATGTTAQYYRGDKTFQTLNTAAVPELTNLYYTDARARSAVSLTTTGSSGASTYSSSTGVLNVPTYTLSGLGGVPTSRQLTINGTAYDLSTDRSWSVGTVTSVSALTLGTTGTDLSSTVATGTTTPVITLNVPTASATNRGALSSTDWSTFNNKQGTITLTTTGTSGAATFVANTLNIPNYADGGVLSLSAIGAVPNANAGTITGTVLNLQPADASFGGVVTIGTQSFAGAKTFSSSVTASSLIKSGGTSAQILAADGSVITAGTNVTISGGTISATGGSSTPPVGNTLYLYNYWGGFLNY